MTNNKTILIMNDTSVDLHYGCLSVMSNLKSALKNRNNKLRILSYAAHVDWLNDEFFNAELKKSSLVIINGEGTLHHSRPAAKSLLKLIPVAKKYSIPVAVINATWQDNNKEMIDSLRVADYIAVRESKSFEELYHNNVKAKLVPDLSFFGLNPTFDNKSKRFYFSDSVVRDDAITIFKKNYPDKKMLPMFSHRGLKQRMLLQRMLSRKKYFLDLSMTMDTLLYAFVVQNSIQKNGDALKSKLRASGGVVSGRFHMTTFAIGVGTPFLVLSSNSHKIQGLLKDVDLEHRMIDISDLNTNIVPPYERCEIAAIASYMNEAQITISKMIDVLIQMVR